MKLVVKGPRVLLKVTKAKDTFEGSSIVRADQFKDMDTISQTIAVVEQVGDTAFLRKDSACNGIPWVKVGDTVHFSRYGAIRLNGAIQDPDFEYWVINDKDILAIQETEESDIKEEVKDE